MAKKSLEMILVTCRTVEQGAAREGEKMGYSYQRACGVCYMDYEDMKELDILPGDYVRVKSPYGEVVLRAERSRDEPHKGILVVPLGPWGNKIVDPKTSSTGMPSFKATRVVVEPAFESTVPSVRTLISSLQS